VKLKRKINLTKKPKKSNEWGSKLKKKRFWLKGEIKKKNQFNKKTNKNNTIKKIKTKLEKNIISQIRIEGWNKKKQIKLLQKNQEQELQIKRIRTEFDISINKRTTIKFYIISMIFKEMREKNKSKRKKRLSLSHYHLMPFQKEKDVSTLPMTWRKVMFNC